MLDDALATVLAYHERSKHHPHRYAAALGYLDWASQPDPFRTYAGAARTPLPLAGAGLTASFATLYAPGTPPQPVSIESVGALLELTLGLSAWKRAGASRWALRCNPSSGNLHPTEGYLLAGGVSGVPDGVHHYVSRDHLLEHRCAANLTLAPGTLLLGFSSIHWREAWKYGERAFRYCQHDLGHAVAAARYAAAVLGWQARLLETPGDGDVAALLGLDRAGDFGDSEAEHPEALLLVGPAPLPGESGLALDTLIGAARGGRWAGKANRLSDTRHPWPVIEEAATAAAKPRRQPENAAPLPARPASVSPAPLMDGRQDASAVQIIRRRRSALGFDGETGLPLPGFYRMLERLIPQVDTPPWDVLPWLPRVHPVFLVHRVPGLTPGVYVAPRDPAVVPRLRAALKGGFLWRRPASCPEGIELYLLQEADAREAARTLSCHQEIAADGAFTLGMLADFRTGLREWGAWGYRRFFWEAGVLGHVLYLEAEAQGLRGTGIGCYFDDLFHGVLGLDSHEFQSMYHFTVGLPVEDPRIQNEPAYAHLGR